MKAATGGGFDVVFEAVGTEDSLVTCIDAVKPGEKIIIISNSIPLMILLSMNCVVLQEIHLIGGISCTRKEFTETIELIASGMIAPEK